MDVATASRVSKLPVYIPKIGCGLGGLSWDDEVKTIVADAFYDITVKVCQI
jgi:hypothetical protein